MQARLSLVTLGVEHFDRAVAFYRDGLGLPLQPQSSGDVAFFGLAGVWLALYPRHLLAEDAGVPAAGSGFRGFTLAHNLRSEPEVDALIAQACAAGATLVKPAQKTFWGGYSGYFADPEGFLWEIAHNPHFWIE